MTRKHFQLLADYLKEIESKEVRQVAANAVAYACAESNSSFDRARFMKACGLSEE